MVTFVGAEYVIANILIAAKKNLRRDSISLAEMYSAATYIQKQAMNEGVNAIFMCSTDNISAAVHDFPDYFGYEAKKKEIYRKPKRLSDLESRFIGYLPFNVLTFLVKTANEAVAQQT